MQNIVKTLMSGFKALVNKKIRGSIADWNQNDSEADNYVKNRPFFTDEGMVVHKLDVKYLPDSVANTSDVAELQSFVENEFSEMQTSVDALQTEMDTAEGNIATLQINVNQKMNASNPVGTGTFSMNGTATGDYSSADGVGANATYRSQRVQGEFNIVDITKYSLTQKESIIAMQNSKEYPCYCAIESYDEINGTITLTDFYRDIEGGEGGQVGLFVYESDISRINGATSDQDTFGVYQITSLNTFTNSITIYNATYYQFVKPSKSDRGINAHIVGNGTSDTSRSNAHTLAWDGTAWYQGDVYVGSTSGTNKDEGSRKLMKEPTYEETVNDLIEADLLPAVSTPSGAVLTDQNGNVVLRY